jgi:hypothetical protein
MVTPRVFELMSSDGVTPQLCTLVGNTDRLREVFGAPRYDVPLELARLSRRRELETRTPRRVN